MGEFECEGVGAVAQEVRDFAGHPVDAVEGHGAFARLGAVQVDGHAVAFGLGEVPKDEPCAPFAGGEVEVAAEQGGPLGVVEGDVGTRHGAVEERPGGVVESGVEPFGGRAGGAFLVALVRDVAFGVFGAVLGGERVAAPVAGEVEGTGAPSGELGDFGECAVLPRADGGVKPAGGDGLRRAVGLAKVVAEAGIHERAMLDEDGVGAVVEFSVGLEELDHFVAVVLAHEVAPGG